MEDPLVMYLHVMFKYFVLLWLSTIVVLLLVSGQHSGLFQSTHILDSEQLSTCSERATAAGAHQKVISCFLAGNSTPDVHQALEKSASRVAQMLPGWRLRVYHSGDGATTTLLESIFPHVDVCPSPYDVPADAWAPLADPLVDVFVSRRVDALPTEREVSAVQHWLLSPLVFHVMRDHPSQSQAITDGLWGAKVYRNRNLMKATWQELTWRNSSAKELLEASLWPKMKENVLQHDSYLCSEPTFQAHGNVFPWPRQRTRPLLEYAGGAPGQQVESTCPPECRPAGHQDWIFC